jgi:hypothetical protein
MGHQGSKTTVYPQRPLNNDNFEPVGLFHLLSKNVKSCDRLGRRQHAIVDQYLVHLKMAALITMPDKNGNICRR